MRIQYVADDGTIFNTARECREYEERQARSDAGCLGFILGALDHGLRILRGSASECARK
jgi:hypothetical protein